MALRRSAPVDPGRDRRRPLVRRQRLRRRYHPRPRYGSRLPRVRLRLRHQSGLRCPGESRRPRDVRHHRPRPRDLPLPAKHDGLLPDSLTGCPISLRPRRPISASGRNADVLGFGGARAANSSRRSLPSPNPLPAGRGPRPMPPSSPSRRCRRTSRPLPPCRGAAAAGRSGRRAPGSGGRASRPRWQGRACPCG